IASVVSWRLNEHARATTERVLDSMAEGIYGLDLDGRITFANPSAARLLGYRPAGLLGKLVHEVARRPASHQPSTLEGTQPLHEAIRNQAPTRGVRDLWQRRDASTIPVEYRVAPIHDARGPAGCVVTITDL